MGMKHKILILCAAACFLLACVPTSRAPTVQEVDTPASQNTEPIASLAATESVDSPDGDLTVTWLDVDVAAELTQMDFPDAQSIDVTLAAEGMVYVALGMNDHIFVARSTDHGRTFEEPVQVSHSVEALMLAVERPAIFSAANGSIGVAWSTPEFPGRIAYALSHDGGKTFGESLSVSGSPAPETVLVRMTLDQNDNPLAAWLSDRTLRIARSFDGGQSFDAYQLLDEQTCDCCHPQPLIVGENVFIAYRNLIEDEEGRDIRDIFMIASQNGGATFGEEVRVSDAHWYLSACPISGPSLVSKDGTLYVSWMDGRNDAHGNLTHTDIWLSMSDDGGQSFSANRRVNLETGVYHNLPALAIDAQGRLHIAWERRDGDHGVIYYARSDDGGQSFTRPWSVVDSADGSGRKRPGNVSMALGEDGSVYLTWVDTLGAHLAAWQAR